MPVDTTGMPLLPVRFTHQLFPKLMGLGVALSFVGLMGWIALREPSWIAGTALAVLGLFTGLIFVELLHSSLHGKVTYIVDELGLSRGRGARLRQLFAWTELTGWSHHENSDYDNFWRFETPGKTWRIYQHEVNVPSADQFEAAVTAAIGRPPDREPIADEAGKRFKS